MHDALDVGSTTKENHSVTIRIQHKGSSPVTLTLASFQAGSRIAVIGMLNSLVTESKGQVRVVTADLGAGVGGDIAIALYDDGDDIGRFMQCVADLRERQKIHIVFVLVAESARLAFSSHRNELPTKHVFEMPLSSSDLGNAVMTAVVALKLKDEIRPGKTSYATQAKYLGAMLVEHRIIDPLQLKKALDFQKSSNQRLGEVLVLLGYITEEQKMLFLAQQLGVEIATPRQFTAAPMEVVALLPEHVCRNGICIALEKKERTLFVAMENVQDLVLLDSLRDLTALVIKPMLGTREDIVSCIERYYRDISSNESASALVDNLGGDVEYVEQRTEEVDIEEATAAGSGVGVIRLVNNLILNAVRDKASDIHFEPQEKNLLVRYRIDGDLKTVMAPPKQLHAAIVARIKILSNLDIAERRLPQDGRMVVKIRAREIDVRVSILPAVHGEAAVLRILDKDAFEKSASNLGFNPHHFEIFKSHIIKPYGMVVVTGPTGSGKSTTLYSAIQHIKSATRNIVTVEDPVEFLIDGVRQVHINAGIGLTFGAVLRSILRQDPDIILIGEIRDRETADTAIKMALTGHLVFSTLHTNDAVSSISRFIDIGIPPLLLSSSLNLVIAQRLVRRICPHCKVEYQPDPELLEQLNLTIKPMPKFYRGQGCVACHGSGYLGRTGLFEMLNVTKAIRTLILRNAPAIEILETALREGMITVRRAGIEKVLAGETTIEQVIAVSTDV
jgi:type IV pilus assembly protein PilB